MINVPGFNIKKFNFPCGEMQIQVIDGSTNVEIATVDFDFERNEEVFELALVCDALRRIGCRNLSLNMDYVPFSRQDRINAFGEAFSLKVFSKIINSLGFDNVFVLDPHSDVTTALIENCKVIEQHQIFNEPLHQLEIIGKGFYLICPDAGAMKKIFKTAKRFKNLGVIECSKQRDTATGEITGVNVAAEDLGGKDCVIMDDICDGGRTFIEIAKILKTKHCGRIILMTTHGFFTKGLAVFEGLIDEIWSSKGLVYSVPNNERQQ